MSVRVLVVDDEKPFGETLCLDLARRGHRPSWVASAQEALAALSLGSADVVVTDVRLRGGGMDGMALCAAVASSHPDVPVIVITGFGSMETAIAGIRAGAYDFLSKPFDTEVLALAVDRAAKHRELNSEVKRLREALDAPSFEELLGDSAGMRRAFDLMNRVAKSDASVLVTGEGGTGKELTARALHRRSLRASGPFVTVPCSSIPEGLLEGELFGRSGADGQAASPGLFVQAAGGTLYFDEVVDLPLELQAKLVRVLHERAVTPVGGSRPVPVDVRVVATTTRDIESAVEERRFREDLFFRINVVRIELPALRARGNDILLLAQHHLSRAAARGRRKVTGISVAAAERLLSYPWPGNVRELANAMERAVALAAYPQIMPDDLPQRVRDHQGSAFVVGGDDPSELVSMEEVERRYVLRVLEAVNGNKTLAARILGFDRKTLYRKLERYTDAPLAANG
jgi:DNA-binding NtrC family response regulator